MKIDVPYGKESLEVEIDAGRVVGIYRSNAVDVADAKALMEGCLAQPAGGPDFASFLQNASDLMIIVNDATRPTPTAQVMELIASQLEGKAVKIICATGAHRGPTDEEWQSILGGCYEQFRDHLLAHDAKLSETTFLGTSKNGTDMHLNTEVVDADSVLVIGSVEPHYFAGYTGGRKGFLPGVAAYKTIEQNHKFALEDSAKALALEGNPVHEDMVDAMDVLADKKVFSIQTVLDRNHNIYGVTAGDIHKSFDAAISMAHDVFCIDIPEKADIVVASAPYPMDIDLYQSQKALENGRLALKPGGILILVAQCRDGIGGNTFYQLLSSFDDPDMVLDTIAKGYKLGYHKAAKIVGLARYGSIWGITQVDDDSMRHVFIEPKHDMQKAVDEALALKGEDARVIFMPEASITVPSIQKEHH